MWCMLDPLKKWRERQRQRQRERGYANTQSHRVRGVMSPYLFEALDSDGTKGRENLHDTVEVVQLIKAIA